MRKLVIVVALIVPTVGLAGDQVGYRPWCKNPAHGRSYSGGYGWISTTFYNSDDCWEFANGHKQNGHETGCSSVNLNTGEYKD